MTVDSLLEVRLRAANDFLKVKETLQRMGIDHGRDLVQACYILHKRGKYYICHYKELMALDGQNNEVTDADRGKRNTIATLLEAWGLLTIVDPTRAEEPRSSVKVISHRDREQWNLVSRYSIGKTR